MVRSKKYVTQSTTLRRSKHPSPAVATSQTKPDTANKNPTEGDHLELLERIKQRVKQIEERHDRARWLGRPRIHTALFEDVAKDEEHANLAAKFGAKFAGSQVAERARKLDDLMSTLSLSGERRALFNKLIVAYRREATIDRYVQIRRAFPEVEIQISRFGGIDVLLTLREDFKNQGIQFDLVTAALDGDEPSIDALSLHLLECLVARSKLPSDGPGHIERRRSAISDATVNYLISIMLEGFDWHQETFRMPASLIVLIWHQLCGQMPEPHQAFLSRERRDAAALRAAQCFESGQKISVRKLASVTGAPRTTAARWLADANFKESLQAYQRWGRIKKAGQSVRRPRSSP